ncbi:VOC family protein [Paraglaciecola marina]|uniref:VOC family protein n=1 Tax=Paraglaciecola marina TaxID=2500157 RepID=UPI00105FEA03|nr:VOC family protein [Paraglaciecola marina]
MIGYVTLGTTSLEKSGAFYDALLSTIGATRFMEEPGYFIAWATAENEPSLGVSIPFNNGPATVGNGTMVAIALETSAQVTEFYNKALALGAACEGKPGFRPDGASTGFYGAYFRDLDGNKLNGFCVVK